jgi:hypothetical protein
MSSAKAFKASHSLNKPMPAFVLKSERLKRMWSQTLSRERALMQPSKLPTFRASVREDPIVNLYSGSVLLREARKGRQDVLDETISMEEYLFTHGIESLRDTVHLNPENPSELYPHECSFMHMLILHGSPELLKTCLDEIYTFSLCGELNLEFKDTKRQLTALEMATKINRLKTKADQIAPFTSEVLAQLTASRLDEDYLV